MEALRALGEDVWFTLGDQDHAVCLARARRLASGATLTAAADDLRRALGVPARVLPMCDEPVRTHVKARGVWSGLQDWLIRERAAAPVEDVEFRGAEDAEPTAEVLQALADARAVIVGPSNPVISIGPMLAIRGLRDALRDCPGPVIAVSPLVGGRSLKGPTEECLEWAGQPLTSDGIAGYYETLLDGLVADKRSASLPTLETDVAMPDAAGRRRVAQEALDFALALG
jgi:LPPG:FO 2-phospho-L-lactate transferase